MGPTCPTCARIRRNKQISARLARLDTWAFVLFLAMLICALWTLGRQ
jgi:hypothetical protein